MPANPPGPQQKGWHNDAGNSRLEIAYDGTKVGHIDANGLYNEAGRRTESLTVVDDNSINMTLAAADILAGINVHTSVTSAATVTTDTAANIISDLPLTVDNQAVTSYYLNDGNQVATFLGGNSVTVADVGNTILANEAAVLIWRRVTSTTVTLYIVTS